MSCCERVNFADKKNHFSVIFTNMNAPREYDPTKDPRLWSKKWINSLQESLSQRVKCFKKTSAVQISKIARGKNFFSAKIIIISGSSFGAHTSA